MSYRVSKAKAKKPSFLRSSSSPFTNIKTRKPVQRSHTKPETTEGVDDFDDQLEDLGLVETLQTELILRDVPQAMIYIKTHMFDDLPEKSGINSTRTAQILTFRKTLPPLVTNAHVHALINSPTMVEKEIGQLAVSGALRRIIVPGRGTGASSISDALIITQDWIGILENSQIPQPLKGKFTYFLLYPRSRIV